MASPQVENGHTRIAHELMGAILKARLSAPQMAVLFFVLRMSYGWGRKETGRLSVREIASECGGIPKATASHAIRALVERKIMAPIEGGFWAINKDYDTWVLANPLAKTTKKVANPLAKTANPLAKTANPLATLHIVKKKEKRNGTLSPIQRVVEAFKLAKKIPLDDEAWDADNYSRCAKAAKWLLSGTSGVVENAISYMKQRGAYLESKGCEWTLETIARNASDRAPVSERKPQETRDQWDLEREKMRQRKDATAPPAEY